MKVYVGPERKLWEFPEDFLCDKIEFFRAAFKSGFIEASTKEIFLQEDDADAFGRLVDWLFTGELSCPCPGGLVECSASCQLTWCNLYILADKWDVEELVDQAFDHITYIMSCNHQARVFRIASTIAKHVYEHNGEALMEPLRNYMVRQATEYFFCPGDKPLEGWIEATSSHPVFHAEVAKAIKLHLRLKAEDCPWRASYMTGCDIHHEGGSRL